MPMYEVSIRKCEGHRNWWHWWRITQRPIGLKRAVALADAQDCHAAVCVWQTAEKVHDNGKPPANPEG